MGAPKAQGRLQTVDVLHEAVLRGLTGRLIAERGGTPVYVVHLMHGEIVGASGPDDDSWLVRRLVSNGAITERQGTALTQQIEQTRALAPELFDHVPRPLYRRLRTERFRQKLLDFIQCDAPVRFEPVRALFYDRAEHGHQSVSLVDELDALRDRVEPLRDRPPGPYRLHPGPEAPGERDQARLLDVIEPSMDLQDLLTHSPFEEGRTLDLVRDMLERQCLVSTPPLRAVQAPAGPSAGPDLDFAEELLFFDETPAPSTAPGVVRPSDHDTVLGRLVRSPRLLSAFEDPSILADMEPDPGDWGEGAPYDHPQRPEPEGPGVANVFDDALLDALVLDDEALVDALVHEDAELLDALVHDDTTNGLPAEPSLHQLMAMASEGTDPQAGLHALIAPLGLDAELPLPELDAAALLPLGQPIPPPPPVAPPPVSTSSEPTAQTVDDPAPLEPEPSAELAAALRRAEAQQARRDRARMSADYGEDDALQASHPPRDDLSVLEHAPEDGDLAAGDAAGDALFDIDDAPVPDELVDTQPPRTDLFDFGGDAEDEEMLMFQDHDRFRGAGQGQFTLADRLLDHVDLGGRDSGADTLPPPVRFPGVPSAGPEEDDDAFGLLAMGDAETASLTHADKVVALNFGAPRLELSDLHRKLDVATDVLCRVSQALDRQLGPGAGQASVQLLLDGAPSAYAVVFQGLDARPDGTFDVTAAADNIQRRPEGEHRRLIDSGTMDLIERGLSYAVAELDDDAMDGLLESIAGYQQRLRS